MKTHIKTAIQFIKFCLVGASNTLVSLGIYYALTFFGVQYITANIFGYLISILNAFILSDRFVFKEKAVDNKQTLHRLIKIYISYGLMLLLSTGLLYFWVDYLRINKSLAPWINICITTPLNYILNKFWVFRKSN